MFPRNKVNNRDIIAIMSNAINGQLITHDSEGAIKRDYLYRVSIKALIYNGGGMDYGETFESALKRELYEEVGYKGNLRYQLFDASDEIYIERIDANQICFSCRVWTENFDFSAGVDADEVMFIDPEELRLQESESGAPLRYKVHLKWQKLCGANSLPTE